MTGHGPLGTSSTPPARGRGPFWPHYPGRELFRGRQLHTADYVSAEEFAGKRVIIVGAGVSAVQLLDEISRVAKTTWMTRREPDWVEEDFDIPARIAALAGVEERVRQGLPPGSVISVTGMHWTPWARAAQARGVLVRHPMFTAIETRRRADAGRLVPRGRRHPVGDRLPARPRPPRSARAAHAGRGIRVEGTVAIDEPRLHLIGYGPSQSTIGANRAGRAAVAAIVAEREPVAA